MLYNNNTVADTEKYYNNTRGYYNIILINDSNVLNTEQSKTYRHFFSAEGIFSLHKNS